jgi:hypothetical protein
MTSDAGLLQKFKNFLCIFNGPLKFISNTHKMFTNSHFYRGAHCVDTNRTPIDTRRTPIYKPRSLASQNLLFTFSLLLIG